MRHFDCPAKNATSYVGAATRSPSQKDAIIGVPRWRIPGSGHGSTFRDSRSHCRDPCVLRDDLSGLLDKRTPTAGAPVNFISVPIGQAYPVGHELPNITSELPGNSWRPVCYYSAPSSYLSQSCQSEVQSVGPKGLIDTCVMAWSGVAPCQCQVPAAIRTQSPARM